jgi:hypothetical protein
MEDLKGPVPIVLILIMVYWIGSLLLSGEALSHEAPTGWSYPHSCCSNQDCRQDDNAVRVVKGGWEIVQTGEFVAHNDARRKDSPDGLVHICMVAGDFESENAHMICLFTPPMGF